MGNRHRKTGPKTAAADTEAHKSADETAGQVKKRKDLSDGQVLDGIPWVAILIIIFFFAFLPLLPSTVKYHGDEMFYTDPAIRMVQTGDYFTPYYYDGTLQLRKPIITYWAVVASYKIFGINLFSSRIPFLIAGCLIIWFTY